jgi:hypothetical protein
LGPGLGRGLVAAAGGKKKQGEGQGGQYGPKPDAGRLIEATGHLVSYLSEGMDKKAKEIFSAWRRLKLIGGAWGRAADYE